MVLTQNQVKDIEVVISEAFNKPIIIQALTKVIGGIIAERMESLQNIYEAKIQNLISENDNLKTELNKLEQYTRRNSVRVFGIAEQAGENLEERVLSVINKNLKINMTNDKIDRIHRIGKKINNKTRPIIVKFTSYRYKSEVYKNKKLLKGTKTTIREDLTTSRLQELKQAIEIYGPKNVWTHDGNIIVKNNIGEIVNITKQSNDKN